MGVGLRTDAAEACALVAKVADVDLPSPKILAKTYWCTRGRGYGTTKIGDHPLRTSSNVPADIHEAAGFFAALRMTRFRHSHCMHVILSVAKNPVAVSPDEISKLMTGEYRRDARCTSGTGISAVRTSPPRGNLCLQSSRFERCLRTVKHPDLGF